MNDLIPDTVATFLNLRRFPARCDVRQSAAILGLNEDHIPLLVRYNLLSPLGEPVPNSPKFFFTQDLLAKAGDAKWLAKATKCVSRHLREKKLAARHHVSTTTTAHPEKAA